MIEGNPGKSGKRTDRNRKIGAIYRSDETDCKDCGLYFSKRRECPERNR